MKKLLLGATALMAASLPTVSAAQDTQETGGSVFDIIVTAQKRAENIQDIPISIAAMGSEDLAKRGIASVSDLGSTIPDLQTVAHPNSATSQRIFIRGIGANDDQFTIDPSVAVYIDGVYVARSQGLAADNADLERIEVLRGPQGTLYGRNATGGAVNFITKPPELGEFRLKQSLSFGNYSQFRSHTMLNVPLGDKLAVQLAFLRTEKNGFVKNIGTGVSRFGDQRRSSWRGAIEWHPLDNLELRYAYDRSEIKDTPVYLAAVPMFPVTGTRPTEGSPFVDGLKRNDVVVQGHNLTASLGISDNITLKSITGYRKLKSFTWMDYHSGVFSPGRFLINQFDQHHKQFSEELQLIGNNADRTINYISGAYYFEEQATSLDSNQLFGADWNDRDLWIKNKAYAIYGQASWQLPFDERFTVTGGLRYSADNRRADMVQMHRTADGLIYGITPPGNAKRKFSNVSPYFSLEFQPTPLLNFYAKWARGYKSGGFNTRASSIAAFEKGFGEESNTVIEVGAKTELLDRRLRFNAALFTGKYKDIQVNINSDPNNPNITDLLNAGRANISGLELDMNIHPADNFNLGVSYSYLHAEYKQVITAAGVDITDTIAFVAAPKHTLVANAEYRLPPTPVGNLSAFVEASVQDKRYGTALDKAFIMPSYILLNARLTLADIPVGFGNWQASIFGRNLTNETYYLSYVSAGVPTAQFGDPRSYGVELRFEF